MSVRICTIGVRDFRHHGLVVGSAWTPVDSTLTEKARAALRDYHGRFVQVHPDDVKHLGDLGLRLVDGKLVDLVDLTPAPTPKPTPPTTNASKSAPKGDGKKD